MDALTPIAWIVVGYAALVAAAGAVGAALKAPRPRWLDQMAWMLELLAVVLALGALGAVAGGDRPESMATHLGYAAALMCLVPIALQAVRGDRGPWSSGVVAVSAVGVGVVALRLLMTR